MKKKNTKQPSGAKTAQDNKKEALLKAGLELFGKFGLEATSTRMLAASSGANIAAISYYFVNKEGLYHAVVQHVAQKIQMLMWPTLKEIQAQMSSQPNLSPQQAAGCLIELVRLMSGVILQFETPKSWIQIMVREQASPTGAFDTFYKMQMKPMQGTFARLIGSCLNRDPSSDEVKIRVHALMGQILFFIISPEGLLRQLGTRKLKAEHICLIQETLVEHALSCVGSPIKSSEEK